MQQRFSTCNATMLRASCSDLLLVLLHLFARGKFPCHLQRNGVALQVARKTSSCDSPCLQLVSERKIALQVAEKVEAVSTFRNATRQVAACDTPTATCLAIFLRRNQSQYDIIRMFLLLKLFNTNSEICY